MSWSMRFCSSDRNWWSERGRGVGADCLFSSAWWVCARVVRCFAPLAACSRRPVVRHLPSLPPTLSLTTHRFTHQVVRRDLLIERRARVGAVRVEDDAAAERLHPGLLGQRARRARRQELLLRCSGGCGNGSGGVCARTSAAAAAVRAGCSKRCNHREVSELHWALLAGGLVALELQGKRKVSTVKCKQQHQI